jgi:hypothetical protein
MMGMPNARKEMAGLMMVLSERQHVHRSEGIRSWFLSWQVFIAKKKSQSYGRTHVFDLSRFPVRLLEGQRVLTLSYHAGVFLIHAIFYQDSQLVICLLGNYETALISQQHS